MVRRLSLAFLYESFPIIILSDPCFNTFDTSDFELAYSCNESPLPHYSYDDSPLPRYSYDESPLPPYSYCESPLPPLTVSEQLWCCYCHTFAFHLQLKLKMRSVIKATTTSHSMTFGTAMMTKLKRYVRRHSSANTCQCRADCRTFALVFNYITDFRKVFLCICVRISTLFVIDNYMIALYT